MRIATTGASGALGGRPVEVDDVDDAAYADGLVEHGLPPEVAAAVATFGLATRRGYLDAVSDVVEQLTGRPPQTVRDVLAEALTSCVTRDRRAGFTPVG